MKSIILFATLFTLCSASPIVIPAGGNVTQALQERQGASGWGSSGLGGCDDNSIVCVSQADSSPGNGDPHQSYWNVQLSDTIDCTDGDCAVDETQTQSMTIGFQIGTNSNFKTGNALEWIQPEFSVSQSWETGNSYKCEATAGQRVAIWQRVAHTDYSVAHTPSGNCGYEPGAYDTYTNIIRAPNDNNQGGEFFCVRDDTPDQHNTGQKGTGYWSIGCPGGPQNYCGP